MIKVIYGLRKFSSWKTLSEPHIMTVQVVCWLLSKRHEVVQWI